MFRTIHIKLVGIFILLIVSLMVVVGTFLMLRVSQFYLDEFAQAMASAFSENEELVAELRAEARSGQPASLMGVLRVYSGILGIDLSQRHYYILDATTGAALSGTDQNGLRTLDITPNIATALSGSPGYQRQLTGSYMDCAVPITGGGHTFIVYIRDDMTRQQALNQELFLIIIEALLLGLAIAVLLAFTLSKTMTTPIEQLTKSALSVASGDFSKKLPVYAGDEIGVLTKTFNDMADVLNDTLDQIGNERDKLGTLFLHMNDGVAAFSRDGRILHMNPAAERMLGMFFSVKLTFDSLFDGIVKLSEVAAMSPRDTMGRSATVGERMLEMSFTTFGAAGLEPAGGVMALIYDVTERARLDKMRREFVSSVSHELRTPLTNVKSYAETLTNPDGLEPGLITRFSQVIMGEADRMARIVSDLLTLSRFDYGKMDWHLTSFPAADLLTGAFEAMRLEAIRRKQTLTLELPALLPVIHADRERIEQVLINILSNAIKYSHENGTIEMTAGIEAPGERGGMFWVTVTDGGIGIPPEDIERVFERFYRVDKARSRASGGTGLGLSIAQEIVQNHGGEILIESAPGRGTKVTMRLPVQS